MRIIFAGTPLFAQIQLNALIAAGHEIVAVYTQPDKPAGRGRHLQASPVKELAFQHHIPVEQPLSLKNSEAAVTLQKYQADVMIVAAYGLILPGAILTIPRLGCINVHASLLPRWRGASPIQAAILAGDVQTGITLIRMDVGLDTGNILAQAMCDIEPMENAATLHDKLAALGAKLLVAKLADIVHRPGDEQNNTLALHCGKLSKAQANLHWALPAMEIERQVRAFNPWPVAYSYLNQHLVRIWQAQAVRFSHQAPPGTILEHRPQGIVVATGLGGLLLLTAQLPNKKMMPMPEILKSQHELFAIQHCFMTTI